MADDGQARVEIRDCVATPSRILLRFDGDPGSPGSDPQAYLVRALPAGPPVSPPGPVVFESASCAVVLRTGSLELEEGTWVEVRFSPVSPRRDDDPAYYVRVSSDLSPRPARRRRYRRIRRWPAEDTWPTLSPRGTGETGVDWASVLNPAALVVGIGLLALVALGFAAMFSADEGDMSTIATAAFGVIGSVVGAFFGVHAGIGAGDRMQETLTGMVDDKEAKIDAMQQELDEARRTAD